MLFIGSWIAGHQVPRDADGLSNYAIPTTINGILAHQRPSTAGGGVSPEWSLWGTMPTAYAGEDMSLCMGWALGATAAVNFAIGGFWRRFPSGVVSGSGSWIGPFGSGAVSRAQPAYSVQYHTFTLTAASIGALANELFWLKFGISITDGVSGCEAFYLSIYLWVP